MEFTARQIAELLQGRIEGDPEVKVNTLAKIEEGHPGALSFLANPKYTQYIYDTDASIIIVNDDFAPEKPINSTLIRVPDAYAAFASLLEYYNKIKHNKTGISSMSFVAQSAKTGENVYIGEFSYVGENCIIGDNVKIYPQVYLGDNVTVGDNTVLLPGVKVYSENIIGKNCRIYGSAVIGGDGFGFAPQDGQQYKKVAQIGNVIIEDDVEIGAGTTIDRATLGSTIIRKGAKLDNLIQIAHNVEIGENTVIAAQAGISGSTKIGRNCMIGGQVGIIGHINIGDDVKIAAQSGISTNIKDGSILIGSPAFEIKQYWKSYAHFKNLDRLAKRVTELEHQLRALKGDSESQSI
jgi:UDP-3-O-[3-hydroxymyristoyl] glucosamine N-acyltransferase